jgi:hypothetical protein
MHRLVLGPGTSETFAIIAFDTVAFLAARRSTLFESQVGVTCMQGQGICKDRSKICNELSTASIELMDVE